MKELINLLANIPVDKYIHFIVGMIIAAVLAFLVPTAMYWCVVPAVLAGLAKEVYDKSDYGLFDTKDLIATGLGGLVIQLLSWLHLIVY